jgi:hypothetical protein
MSSDENQALHRHLRRFYSEGTLLGFYHSERTSGHYLVGVITGLSEEYVVFRNYGLHGEVQELRVFWIGDIVKLVYGGPYLEMIESRVQFPLPGENIAERWEDWEDVLNELKSRGRAVMIEDRHGRTTTGFLSTVDENLYEIQTFSDDDEPVGNAIARVQDVYSIGFGGPLESRLEARYPQNVAESAEE